jgi:hypothetical protein
VPGKYLEINNAYKISVGKPFRRPRSRQEEKHNIKIYLEEIGLEDVDWIHLAHDRDQWRSLVDPANKPYGSIKDEEFPD